MSDSESISGDSEGIATTVREEIKPLQLTHGTGDNERLEEFQKLLRSMMDSRAPSFEDNENQNDQQNVLKNSLATKKRKQSMVLLVALETERVFIEGQYRPVY
ncbi:hypothetical protein QAD02_018255 [Eretmocerus hayati]|uniref:Uncharacterized protein n=1 Tax=Eretmocerus hayati TaxID=131215 RepID=A0ACC2PG75_9HYME|nr:hypothetical protein QAD02_018255 [Eretmocerus hayati]